MSVPLGRWMARAHSVADDVMDQDRHEGLHRGIDEMLIGLLTPPFDRRGALRVGAPLVTGQLGSPTGLGSRSLINTSVPRDVQLGPFGPRRRDQGRACIWWRGLAPLVAEARDGESGATKQIVE